MFLINHIVKSDDKSHEVSGRKGDDSQDIVTEVSTNDQHVDDLNNLKVTNPPPIVTTTTTVAPIKTTKIPRIKTTTVAKSSRFVFFYFFYPKVYAASQLQIILYVFKDFHKGVGSGRAGWAIANPVFGGPKLIIHTKKIS